MSEQRMYFPTLAFIKSEREGRVRIQKEDILLLDWWLATRKTPDWLRLNPLQFGLDCDVAEDVAISLFVEGAFNKEVDLLEFHASMYCLSCDHLIEMSKGGLNFELVPSDCPNCDEIKTNEIIDKQIILTFELKREPKKIHRL